MPLVPITALPAAPSRLDEPATFVTKADAFVAALGGFVTETNDLAEYLEGLSAGTLDGNLAAIAGVTSAANTIPYFTGSETAALADFTAFGRTLVANADAAAARTDLGLGTASTLDTDTDTTLAANSDTKIATQKAVKAYVDANAGGGSGSITGSGYTMTTDRLLGRDTASTGAIEELVIGGGLSIASGTLSVSSTGGVLSGTSFPISPASGDVFRRTDRSIEYYYDGTRWLSTQLFALPIADQSAFNPKTASGTLYTPNPFYGLYDVYVLTCTQLTYVGNASPSSNYFITQFHSVLGATATNIGTTISTQGFTINWHTNSTINPNVVVPSTEAGFDITYTEVGACSQTISAGIVFRLIG